MSDSVRARWFSFDHLLAVIVGRHAFVLGDGGWGPSNRHEVRYHGEPLEDGAAAVEQFSLIWAEIDPELVETCVGLGIAPPRPKLIRRWVMIEQAQTIDGPTRSRCRVLEGNIYIEFDDGTMSPINGKQLAALALLAPRIRRWRLEGRDDYFWL